MVRVADIMGNPQLEQQTGMTLEKFQTAVKLHGFENARNKRLPVEVDDVGN